MFQAGNGSGLLILRNGLGIPAENAGHLLQQISYQINDNKGTAVITAAPQATLHVSGPVGGINSSKISPIPEISQGFIDGIINDRDLFEGLSQSDIESSFKKVPSENLLQGQDILSALDL